MIMWCLPNFAIHAGWIGLSLLIQLHVCLGIVLPTQYDTIWDTQSSNSADSMPLGGGSVGLNVWAESGMPTTEIRLRKLGDHVLTVDR